ncbi:MAG: hypothetical protein AAGB10_18015 [Pseudomonadota bacterium]
MNSILDGFFREDETLHPRMLVAAGIVAYFFHYLAKWFGVSWWITQGLIVLLVAMLCYAVLRFLLPMMDPRDPDADPFVVWGTCFLFLIMGGDGFGALFIPGLIIGAAVLYWRAPELLEVFPWFEKDGNEG